MGKFLCRVGISQYYLNVTTLSPGKMRRILCCLYTFYAIAKGREMQMQSTGTVPGELHIHTWVKVSSFQVAGKLCALLSILLNKSILIVIAILPLTPLHFKCYQTQVLQSSYKLRLVGPDSTVSCISFMSLALPVVSKWQPLRATNFCVFHLRGQGVRLHILNDPRDLCHTPGHMIRLGHIPKVCLSSWLAGYLSALLCTAVPYTHV